MKTLIAIALVVAAAGALLLASFDNGSFAAPFRPCSTVHVQGATRFELRAYESPDAIANAVESPVESSPRRKLLSLGGDVYLAPRYSVIAVERCGARQAK